MERVEWLKQMRAMLQAVYDRISPEYWVSFGFYPNETHVQYLQKFLDRVPPHSTLLSAACGAGRYDGMLLEAGHNVVGIDQSTGMLKRASEHFPQASYRQVSLQDMDFHEEFDGAICMDALEHVCPEDWPGIMNRFRAALKPGGVFYFTVELPDADLPASYTRAKAMGLPVVFGELADEVQTSYERLEELTSEVVPGELASIAVYHYYPSTEQVRAWIEQAGLVLEEQGTGNDYEHFMVKKQDRAWISPLRI